MAVALNIETVLNKYRVLVGSELRRFLDQTQQDAQVEMLSTFYGQMRYHLGWAHADLSPVEGNPGKFLGKFLRPALLLLAHQACLPAQPAAAAAGQLPYQLEQILPAAVAVELVHNFSLIHDDIEDSDALRHHRPTLWKLWGQPQAINTGDGLFCIARLALWELAKNGVDAQTILTLARTFDSACLALCEGQHLDMSFERQREITVALYLTMIGRKTAALMQCATEMGARLATTDANQIARLATFGRSLGIAFQLRDDLLGIWANEHELGKAPAGDIRRKKMSLPIIDALEHAAPAQQERLYAIYAEEGQASDEQVAEVLAIFAASQVRQRCQTRLAEAIQTARQALETFTWNEAGEQAQHELNAMLNYLAHEAQPA
ncbi:MAG TPA: polyprenyl synthetase family protein [Ktedonobacterales bacterium]|nr:polyprenyl synthetase family protein [Ktedonobacterales bacterium]